MEKEILKLIEELDKKIENLNNTSVLCEFGEGRLSAFLYTRKQLYYILNNKGV